MQSPHSTFLLSTVFRATPENTFVGIRSNCFVGGVFTIWSAKSTGMWPGTFEHFRQKSQHSRKRAKNAISAQPWVTRCTYCEYISNL